MPTPSLLIVPARFKSGKIYSQIPTSGAGDFTVTRATSATRVNASGYIESVASGIPRLDYLDSGGVVGCPALLVEPSAINSCLQSENFLTTWSPNNVTVSGNVTGTTDPSGGNKADQIFETDTSGIHILAQTMSIVSGTTYAGSVFLKKAEGSPDWMQVAYSTTGLAGFANFNLTSGTVGNVGAGCTGSIVNYGNGWYRCTLIQTANASGDSGGPVIVFTNNTNSITRYVNYTGNTATSIYAWGAQFETGSVATSYIPTTTAAVTRNADVVVVSGAVSGSIGQTEGTVYAEFQSDAVLDEVFFVSRKSGAGSNKINIIKDSSNLLKVGLVANGTAIFTFGTSGSVTGMIKMALGYQAGSSALYINGDFIVSSTANFTFSSAGLADVTINKSSIFSGGHILRPTMFRAIALYTTRLTNAELTSLTT